jgi:uncharacterized protein YecT (DUF1311 family)
MIRTLALVVFIVGAVAARAGAVQSEREARDECSSTSSQAGMRDCLDKKARASAAELGKAEQQVREAIAKWDEDAQYLELAKTRLAAANAQFARYRDAQCAFNASLSGGGAGNATELRRLACVHELNLRRIEQLKAALVDLPPKS